MICNTSPFVTVNCKLVMTNFSDYPNFLSYIKVIKNFSDVDAQRKPESLAHRFQRINCLIGNANI